ncbi:MAG: hypothetical protein L6W00_17310 [Lentisphaeria bacterium]|nr:MAG: hypothetical protein L6W00_17310 [Lentisphaeria bacterium]
MEPELLDRYLGFRQQRFSRFFLREVADLKQDPELLASLRSFHPFLVACLPTAGEMKSPFAVADRITPELAEAYRNELRSMLGKLGGAVQGVELFNEPHLWRFRDGPRKDFPNMPPRKVAEFYRIAREEIDRMHSPLRLLGPVAGKEYGLAFLDEGGADTIDIYSFHGYNETPDAGKIFEQLTKYRTVLSEKNAPARSGTPRRTTESATTRSGRWTAKHSAPTLPTPNPITRRTAPSIWSTTPPPERWGPLPARLLLERHPGRENLVLEAFSAVNAAIEQLSNAGRGEEFPLGSAFHCFLFPGRRRDRLRCFTPWRRNPMPFSEFPKRSKSATWTATGSPLGPSASETHRSICGSRKRSSERCWAIWNSADWAIPSRSMFPSSAAGSSPSPSPTGPTGRNASPSRRAPPSPSNRPSRKPPCRRAGSECSVSSGKRGTSSRCRSTGCRSNSIPGRRPSPQKRSETGFCHVRRKCRECGAAHRFESRPGLEPAAAYRPGGPRREIRRVLE